VTIQELEERRDAILEQMRGMRSMRRGTVNEQYLEVPRKGGNKPVLRGPYYVFSRREGSKTVSHRLRTTQEVQQTREDVEQHKRFVALCKEFEIVTERLGHLTRSQSGEHEKKKRWSSRSKEMQK